MIFNLAVSLFLIFDSSCLSESSFLFWANKEGARNIVIMRDKMMRMAVMLKNTVFWEMKSAFSRKEKIKDGSSGNWL
jgi:hypothetical protein